jgi:hypothetical protein
MYKYRILPDLGTPLDQSIVAHAALTAACRELRIAPPKLFFIEENPVVGTLQAPSRVLGWADQTTRSIYVLADQPLNTIVHVVFHETFHVDDTWEGDGEERAEEFARDLWGPHSAKTSLVEIVRVLDELSSPVRPSTSAQPANGQSGLLCSSVARAGGVSALCPSALLEKQGEQTGRGFKSSRIQPT